ncbi:MAG: c-type cytochrome [Methylococcaceae bacterium]|nr:c-type cytochrome [Methylococcaceae bacterium]
MALVIWGSLMLMSDLTFAEQVTSDSWRVSPRLAKIANPVAADLSSSTTGKNLYLRECQQCHGETGKGDGAIAAFLGKKVANLTSTEVLRQTDGAIFNKIRTGRMPMPGFKNSLSKDEIWHLINFMRSEFGSADALAHVSSKSINNSAYLSGDKAHEVLFKKSEFPSAQECGGCHLQIYREWSVSRHAFAQISPTFLAYQATLVKLTQGTLGDFCERCHTEVGMFTGEPILAGNSSRAKVALEGITCVVCHRVPEAYGKITGRLPLEPGDIHNPIYGPRKGDELQHVLDTHADNPPKTHREARLLEQVSQPGFCARCHDVRLVNGVRFEDLFSEYKQTPAAKKGVTCQGCHMGPTQGVDSDYPLASAAIVRGTPTRPARRTNHMFPGPDSSIVHPGIFPINPEAQEFARPEEWLSFDVEAGWGTDTFENNVSKDAKFPGIWADPDERKTAREIIEQQLTLLAENRAEATTLMRNGYGLGAVNIVEKEHGLKFDIEVKNLTDGHSVPSGLIAERNVFLQVSVTDADGTIMFRSGDLDPNGDVRDTHSLYVHNGSLPKDDQLFNLRSPILSGTLHGGDREQVLPANYSLSPLIFMRPSDTPSLLFGGIRDLRLQKKSIEALGKRWASYQVEPEALTGRTPYHVNVKLVAGQLPPHLINAISGVGFEYGLSARAIGDKLVELYRVLWEKQVVIK